MAHYLPIREKVCVVRRSLAQPPAQSRADTKGKSNCSQQPCSILKILKGSRTEIPVVLHHSHGKEFIYLFLPWTNRFFLFAILILALSLSTSELVFSI